MSDYIDTVDIEGTQYDIQDTLTKEQAEENTSSIETLAQKISNIGQVTILFRGVTGSKSFSQGNNVLGSFTLPKGKWILVCVFYSTIAWYGVGVDMSGARNYAEVRSVSGADSNEYYRAVDIVEVDSDTVLYPEVYRAAAGTAQIYTNYIKGIKISD